MKNKKGGIDSDVYDQNCNKYLTHCGIPCEDDSTINCPWRKDADSESFWICGPIWHDHVTGESGNVWTMALRLQNNDKAAAVRTLYDAVGKVPPRRDRIIKTMIDREKAEAALQKVQKAFEISPGETPRDVLDYLNERRVPRSMGNLFAFVPKGRLKDILSDEEIKLTGLGQREGLLILWYYLHDKPVYYCTRDIRSKEFKKAPIQDGVLQHPIWNHDALYTQPHVIWGEGMFDCTSLMQQGYGVCGEITCHLHKAHEQDLLQALRWRKRNHADWTLTICLDNDEPKTDGRRPGNEAAERLAILLFEHGVDVKWVRHDVTQEKVDINDLHQQGKNDEIHRMIQGAKYVSELLEVDPDLCLTNVTRMIAHCDYRGVARLVPILTGQDNNKAVHEVIKLTKSDLWNWRDVYTEDIEDIFLYDADVYVVFDRPFRLNTAHYEVYKRANFVVNMRRYQRNRFQKLTFDQLDIKGKRPMWKVSRDANHPDGHEFNLFRPSPLLLQKPKQGASIPPMFDRVFRNLAGSEEMEWQLNHLATFVQTLEKPRTIPIFVGNQGTGKTKVVEFLGRGIGSFMSVGNSEVESSFNSYLMNGVVLVDELASNPGQANQLKNKMKNLVNTNQTVNNKYQKTFSAEINNYVAIASNEHITYVPVQIEHDDRRYTIICGGDDRNLDNCDWFKYEQWENELPDFILYLLSRPIDVAKANRPLMNAKKMELMDVGQDYKIGQVRDYLEQMEFTVLGDEIFKVSDLKDQLNEAKDLRFRLTSKTLIPILKHLGYDVFLKEHQNCIRIRPHESRTLASPIQQASPATTANVGASSTEVIFHPPSEDEKDPQSDVVGEDQVTDNQVEDLWVID